MMDGDGTRRLEGRHRAGARRGSRAWLGVQAVLGCCAVVGLLAVPAAAPAPDFATEVHPILAERCYVCHGEQRDRGGLRLDSRAAILEGGDTPLADWLREPPDAGS